MIEKTKLSLWDFFVSVLSGLAIALSVLAHCIFKDLITWKIIFGQPAALIIVFGIPTIILVGLLFEPLANYITKLLTHWPCKYIKLLSRKKWDENIQSLKKKAGQYIPNEIHGSEYEYCKNWLTQNTSDDSYMPFLAKFGFYRSMFLLMLSNEIIILSIYQLSRIQTLISLFLVVLAFIYFRRSGDFYRHVSVTVYSRFIASFDSKVKRDEASQ
ncbi:MAG: hypothetical protein WC765_06015 [Phycisphaerae bacterium]|jgi:hypothetical protein